MIRFVNAKINIGLNITARRPDGYHDLQTVFYPVGVLNGTPENPEPFCDILEAESLSVNHEAEGIASNESLAPVSYETHGIAYRLTGRRVECPPEKNLLMRAGTLFAEALAREGLDLQKGLVLTLDKHLPDGAGLGGGSADASFALTLLNDLHGHPFTEDALEEMALALGADCPVFVRNRPAYAEGVGERLEPIDLDLSGWWCVVAKPPVYVSTREAFAGVTPRKPERPLRELMRLPVERWRGEVSNDFEASLFPGHPELPALKQLLYDQGAVYASMSGSGSSIYGLFRTRREAQDAIEKLPAQTVGTPCLLTK